MTMTSVSQKVNLVKGNFTALEAAEVVEALLREKIKFHQKQQVQNWVRDCDSDATTLNSRIEELKEEQLKARAFFAEAAKAGANVVINGTLNLSFE